MTAGPQASLELPDDRVSDRLAARLVPILSDGRGHPIDALAARVRASGDQVVAALNVLQSFGMPLFRDARSVTCDAFVPLDETTLRLALPGWRIDVVAMLDSTNSTLLQRVRAAPSADRQAALLATECQRAGRGRLGRAWAAAPGASLTLSCALRVERPLAALEGITLLCGLAVRDALASHGIAASLKWPNDLIVADRKLAGILVEVHAAGGASIVVIGVGLNVSRRTGPEPATGLPPTDLVACGAHAPDRNRIAAGIATALARRLAAFERDGFAPFAAEWTAADAFGGRPVALRTTTDVAHVGVARGVDARGALLLEVDGRIVHVVNGDLSLRPRPSR